VTYPEEDHTLRRVLSFAAGVGLGVGAGNLFAPASGAESRSALSDKVQDIGDKIRERFSATTWSPATGTEPLYLPALWITTFHSKPWMATSEGREPSVHLSPFHRA